MAPETLRTTATETLRRLSKADLDRRLESIAAEITRVDDLPSSDSDPLAPRWISAAELVRRMRPFLVLN